MLRDERGVSVIIGAMLLILITIVAAASLAVIVSQAEKQAADRKALEDAVANEKLKIIGIDLDKSPDRPGYLDSVNITLQNLNTDDSRLVTVYLNDKPARQYNVSEILMGREVISGTPYNLSNRYDVKGSGMAKLILNLSEDFIGPANVTVNNTLTVKVMTSYVNFFNAIFKTPGPSMMTSVESLTFNGVSRDYVVLDGSGSTDERSIVAYDWTIVDTSIPKTYNLSGKTVQFNPESGGPLVVRLTVVNDIGLEGTTKDYAIPYNPDFCSQDLAITPAVNPALKDATGYGGMNVTINNRMPDQVNVSRIFVGDGIHGEVAADNFSVLTATAGLLTDQKSVLIGGSQSVTVYLHFTDNFTAPFTLGVLDPVTVKVVTNYSNAFSQTITPPTAVAKVAVQSLEMSGTLRDYLQLDGSDSSGTGVITGWYWTVANVTTGEVEGVPAGKTARYYPQSGGPYTIGLTITDGTGLNGTANNVLMPYDPNFYSGDITPTAVAQVSVLTQDLGAVSRDYLMLDGSGSTDDRKIAGWNWAIYDGCHTWPAPGNWSDGANVTINNANGRIVQYFPDTAGPLIVSLKVTDSAGNTGMSANCTLPADDNFNPAATMTWGRSGDVLSVYVWDIQGKPVEGAVISFIRQYDPAGNMTFMPYTNATIVSGQANTTVSAGASGTIRMVMKSLIMDIPWA